MRYTIYDAAGRILRSGFKAVGAPGLGAGESMTPERYDDAEWYFVADVVTARPDSPITLDKTTVEADGVDTVTFSNVPAGTQVRVMGPSQSVITVDDGTLSITFDDVGQYAVKFDSFPEKDTVFNVEAK